MVKFTGGSGEHKIVGLGISEQNVQMLKQGHPIIVHGSDLGIGEDILIMYGETEDTIKEQLTPFLGPNTKVEEPE